MAKVTIRKKIFFCWAKHFFLIKSLITIGEEACEIPECTLTPKMDNVNLAKVPEHLRNVPISDVCVFIDPLDATKEFTLGNVAAVCTLIGISIKGQAVGKPKERLRFRTPTTFDFTTKKKKLE